MSQIQTRLDSSRFQIEEVDVFTRLLTSQFWDEEEVRKAWSGDTYEYICLALAGSSIYDPVWHSVRVTWLNGKRIRFQYQANMTYADITSGWAL